MVENEPAKPEDANCFEEDRVLVEHIERAGRGRKKARQSGELLKES
jgi:hypothetical protein